MNSIDMLNLLGCRINLDLSREAPPLGRFEVWGSAGHEWQDCYLHRGFCKCPPVKCS